MTGSGSGKSPMSSWYCHDPMCMRYLKENEIEIHRFNLKHEVEELQEKTFEQMEREEGLM